VTLMTARPFRRIAIFALGMLFAAVGFAQEAAAPDPTPAPPPSDTEEIVVTGSYIKGTPEDAALPVDVTSLDDLKDVGAPSVAELVRNLAYTSGNISETNQFGAGGQGQAAEGVLTMNLRGLGSARTLVLINGRRFVPGEAIGVDLSMLPKLAVGRLEVLKDGAAALYGSDAIGGVANFITRENFEGFEISASEQFIRGSNGDHEVAAIGGWGNDFVHVMGAFEWSRRSELMFRDRDWGLIPFAEQPVGGGWSSIGNPARILPFPSFAGFADPGCNLLGGETSRAPFSSAGTCNFQFTYFDNLVEPQDTYKGYIEANVELPGEFKLHVEGLYAKMDMPRWRSSPSYPPQTFTGPDRFVPITHPGFADMIAQFPGFVPAGTTGAFLINRPIGSAGRPPDGESQFGGRFTEQWRFVAEISGNVGDVVDVTLAASVSQRWRRLTGDDMFVERMAFALDGLGGPNCNQSTGTAGVGGCLFYNPFSNSIQRSAINGAVNPNFNPAVANAPDLINWLFGEYDSRTTNLLATGDLVLSGRLPWSLPGGEIGWAAGATLRHERYKLRTNDLTDLDVLPCPFNNPRSLPFNAITNPLGLGNVTQAAWDACHIPGPNFSPTGAFAFLSGTREQDLDRVVYGFFGELSLPFFDSVDAQLAVRYEDYGGSVGSTIDPKFALSWQALEWLKLRGSVSTTFRGPPQSFLVNRITSLQFVGPTGAFKAVDVVGNPGLDPESALATNAGFVLNWEGLYGSVDYWRFDFEKPFQLESQTQIVSRYLALGCNNGGAGAPLGGPITPDCQALRGHVFPTGTGGAGISRIDTSWINGSDIKTSGIDWYVEYEFEDLFGGTLTFGSSGSYRIEYTSDDFVDIGGTLLAPGLDANGLLNDRTNPFSALPAIKTDVFTKFNRGSHTATIVGRYTSAYEDACPPMVNNLACTNPAALPFGGYDKVDSFFTVDMHYVVRLFDESTALSFSIINVADKDPPPAATELNYDPLTHNPLGRMFKVGLTYTWKPE
jgi:iron complex outermembrane receptor protein